jgi:hypothetical protein
MRTTRVSILAVQCTGCTVLYLLRTAAHTGTSTLQSTSTSTLQYCPDCQPQLVKFHLSSLTSPVNFPTVPVPRILVGRTTILSKNDSHNTHHYIRTSPDPSPDPNLEQTVRMMEQIRFNDMMELCGRLYQVVSQCDVKHN